MRRTYLSILVLSLLLGPAAAAFAQQPPPGRQANARLLLRIADGASRRMVQKAQGLSRDPRSRPFWEALLQMDAQIDRVGAGLKIRDASFFQALRSGTSSLAEMQVTWALSGVKDPDIEQDLRTLSAAYERLRNRYGPEWIRYQTGRPLSEDERQRFARMRAEQSFLAGKLEPLRGQAEQAGDHATAGELTLLLAEIHAVATASATLGDYLDASVATDSIRGAWFGARAAHSTDEEGWAEADQVVSEITTDDSVNFVFTTDSQTVQDWGFVEEETEIPAEIAQEAEEGKREKGEAETPEASEATVLAEEPAEGAAEEGLQEDLPGAAAEAPAGEPSLDSMGSPASEDLAAEPVPAAETAETVEAETIEEEDLDAAADAGEPVPELDACTAEDPACGDDSALLVPPAHPEATPPPAAAPSSLPPPPAALGSPGKPPMG